MSTTFRSPIRILAAVGPGDAVNSFRDWHSGVRTLSETSITYTSQAYEFFATHGIAFWVISSNPRRERIEAGANCIENRPRVGGGRLSGFAYHMAHLLYALSLLYSAVRFRTTHVIVDSGTTHWFAFWMFRAFRIEVLPNFHNVYWPDGHAPRGAVRRTLLRMDSLFFKYAVRTAFGVSPACGQQIGAMSAGRTIFHEYRAQYVRSDFAGLPPPGASAPFRVLFVGRVERDKGVFDVLSIAEALDRRHPGAFAFDICGGGTASEELAREIALRRLAGKVIFHGKLSRPELLTVYAASYIVIVPTRSTFCEGLPMVCAEAVLAGRPVVTSRISNALEVLRGAVVEAREDDPDDYADKIARVALDAKLFAQLAHSTARVSEQFTNPAFGMRARLEQWLSGDGMPRLDGRSA